MTCFLCKGDLQPDSTIHSEQAGNAVVLVKNVPCLKCTQCGEIVYAGDVVRRLEQILDTAQNDMAEIAVLTYREKAA
jgi:YgiT-type zinc finger domain-containing protein